MVDNTVMRSEHRTSSSSWTPTRRRLVSAILLAHLAAIFIAPWSSPPPAPLLAEQAARLLSPYLIAAYLNHGYRFFAPDPGPSHLVRYSMTRADGTVLEGRIPDPQRDWPRLLYHRHFMITETLFNTISRVEEIPDDADLPAAEREWIEIQNRYARSLAHSICRREWLNSCSDNSTDRACSSSCRSTRFRIRRTCSRASDLMRRTCMQIWPTWACFQGVSHDEWPQSYWRDSTSTVIGSWNRFWFTPADPATLGVNPCFSPG